MRCEVKIFFVKPLNIVPNLVSLCKERNMGTKKKLLDRFRTLPKDFTFEETVTLLSALGYIIQNKGATSGSRVRFYNEELGTSINLHRPHPGSIMKEWMMKEIAGHLRENGLI